MRILIDECLSPALVTVANDLGFEAYYVAHRGWAGYTDGQLMREILREEFVLVTNNRDDFLGLIRGVELHPGLIVFLDNVRRSVQLDLFAIALSAATALPSMINRVIEIDASGNVNCYALPQV